MIDFVPILILVAFLVFPFVAVLFVLRLVVAIFSAKTVAEIRRHPVIHTIWGCLALVGVFASLGVIHPDMWPPRSVERGRQRAEVLKRIEGAGGWAALQRDCDALVKQHRDGTFLWRPGSTNALPRTLAALKPWSVNFYSPTFLRSFKDEPQLFRSRFSVVTRQEDVRGPYFRLEVVCATNIESYRSEPSHGGASGNRYDSYNRVSERIYETC